MTTTDRSIPDIRRSLALDLTTAAAWCVDPDGDAWPWIVHAEPTDANGCACATCAPHDQAGAYPLALDRCRAPTQHGAPCRRRVRQPGPCWQHRRPRLQRTIQRLAAWRAAEVRRRLHDTD